MLKRLELIGFKSFAAKTTLEFPRGISAIVGPNGSGKSNVIDALRWLLGERDAKNLRGGKAEDLIFAGTPAKSRVGMAQASIYFDNSSSFFPVEFSEVVVSRQVSRDGESRYFLNKAEVRLRDIVDFFARVRLGAKGLIVIGQGASDLFIAATPQERREMIEEILGLREYQLKKSEAERKHKATILNLDKVSALVEEIAPHLRILRRQTAKWEKRSELESELRGLEHGFFGVRLAEVNSNFSRLDPLVAELETKIEAGREELKKLEAEVQKIEQDEPEHHGEIKQIKADQSVILHKRSAFEKELGRLEAQLEFLASKKDEPLEVNAARAVELLKKLRLELERFSDMNLEEIRDAAQALLQEIGGLFRSGQGNIPDLREIRESRERIAASLTELNAELEALRAREFALAETLEAQSAVFKKALGAVEERKNAIYALEGERNKLLFEKERWNLRLEDLKTQVVRAGIHFGEFEIKAAAMDLASVNPVESERRIMRLRGELASIGDIDEATLKEAAETESRHAFLASQSEDLKKALEDLENLRKELGEKIDRDFESSLHRINEEFARLFELMFGGGKAKLKVRMEAKKTGKKEEEAAEEEAVTEAKAGEPEEEREGIAGIDIEVSIPRKRITGLDMLSGGERSLVSIAALFAMVSVSPPPFLVLDEIDAALDERNARRFAGMLKSFAEKTQFVVVTHNRATMEAADVLYGVTMGEDGTSRVLSLKLEEAPAGGSA